MSAELFEQKKPLLKWPLLIAACVFSLGMAAVWWGKIGELDQMVVYVGVSYALICFAFLLFQIYAFVVAHISYDEQIENIKYKVFELEKDQ